MGETKIEWADRVWNPVAGCTKVSEGCRSCYAERMAKRLAHMPKATNKYSGTVSEKGWTGAIQLDHFSLDEPLRWKKPARIFVCSMGDLFHEGVPDEFRDRVFAVMALAPQHTFLVLTKRPEQMYDYMLNTNWSEHANTIYDAHIRRLESPMFHDGEIVPPLPNVMLGVSVEDQKTADERIPLLMKTPAYLRFVSYEPAIGPIDFSEWFPPFTECSAFDSGCRRPENPAGCADLNKTPEWGSCHPKWCVFGKRMIDLVIMGGESGPGARPMHPDWARSVRDQCKAAGVPFFFKQWGEWAPLDDNSEALSTHENTMCWAHGVWSKGRYGSHSGEKAVNMIRVGKKAASCLLDGKEYKERP